MKKYKYKFTKLITVLIYVGLVLCVAGFAVNVYLVATADIATAQNKFYPILQYTLMFFVSTFLFIVLISLLLSSYYAIDGKYFKTSFGIIKSKFAISEISTIILDRTTEKLTVFFGENKFIVVNVREEWKNDFIDEICKANRSIEFTIRSKDSTDDKK